MRLEDLKPKSITWRLNTASGWKPSPSRALQNCRLARKTPFIFRALKGVIQSGGCYKMVPLGGIIWWIKKFWMSYSTLVWLRLLIY